MPTPIRWELDVARLQARERRLRLVMDILRGREEEQARTGRATPEPLRQSMADFGAQLRRVHREQAALARVTQRRQPAAGRH